MEKRAENNSIQLYTRIHKPGGSRVRQKKVYRGRPKCVKRRKKTGFRTYTPLPQQERIKQKYSDGMSIRRIAREEHKARETVTKIVRTLDKAVHLARLKQQIFGLMEAVVPALERALDSPKDGAWIAMELATRFGILPPKPKWQCPHCGR
jgi:transposase-like protein